jgi:signal transduction histidine kinase
MLSLKVRDKLFIGFGLYIFSAAILGFFAYKELRMIGTRLSLIQAVDDMSNIALQIRHDEKNYLLFKDAEGYDELQKNLGALKKSIAAMKPVIVGKEGGDGFATLQAAIAEYEQRVGAIEDRYRDARELEARIRITGAKEEQSLKGSELDLFLVLRRHEKNLMLYRTPEAYLIFKRAEEASPISGQPHVREYAALVRQLYHLEESGKSDRDKLRATALHIQSFTRDLSQKERANLAATVNMSITLLITALLLVIAIGLIINLKLGTSIATPIRALEKLTQKIARDDFPEQIEVAGQDELSSLEASFVFMEDKLKRAMTSLEAAVYKLQEKQARLVEAEKLASMGKMAAGIAHEINNPLTSVLTFSNLMLEQCPPDDPRHDKLALMVRETNRARTIVRQLLNFGREIVINPVNLNVNQPVKEITDSLIAQEAFEGMELELKLGEKLPLVHADPAQIGQVIMNMLLNAIHAVTPPGRIVVSTQKDGRNVDIVFSDTGAGIPEENIHKIFDPFFTTKDASKGSGLGLAVSYGIVKKHGGEILVTSSVGKGTTFTVRLPVYE